MRNGGQNSVTLLYIARNLARRKRGAGKEMQAGKGRPRP